MKRRLVGDRAPKDFNPIGLKVRKSAMKKFGSSTPGSSKPNGCTAGPEDRWMAKKSRSYKDRNYCSWCAKMDKMD